MINKFIEAWNKNKSDLEDYFKTHCQSEYDSYGSLVKLIFDIVINPELEGYYGSTYDTNNMYCIDDGDYRGTQIFLLHKTRYQPDETDYVFTHTYYGSCSGCDTLLAISDYRDGLPDNEQVADYMSLCLHLVEKCKYLGG